MGRFNYLKAGHWGLSTDKANADLSYLWQPFLRKPCRQSALAFLRAYNRMCLKVKEAASIAVLEVVHFRMQVMCEEHGLPMDEMWNAIIRRKVHGKEEDECEGI